MNKDTNLVNILFASCFIILSLVVSRLAPHPPNFTPVLASAIFAPYIFKSKYLPIVIVIAAMIISDLFIGMHKLVFFIYLPIIICSFISCSLKLKINQYISFLSTSFVGAVIFFIISNFGVWLMTDLYQKSWNGLMSCYVMAIPFFKNTLISTFLYLVLFIIIYQFIIKAINNFMKFPIKLFDLNTISRKY